MRKPTVSVRLAWPATAFDHLAVDDGDHQRHPGGDGEDDRGAAERHRPVAGDPRHRRHRVLVGVGAPLAAGLRRVALAAAEHDQLDSVTGGWSSARRGT